MMQTWSGAWIASSAPSTTWDADIDIVLLPHRHRPPHMMTTPVITIRPQAPTQGMEIIIALVDRTLVMMILAQTQGAGSSIAMLVLMNVLNKIKLFTKIVIKRLAMPTMGMTTNPKTTSSTTWTRHLIVKPMWMLKTKVIKIHQGVISGIILAMTKGAEDNPNMIKMRGPTLGNANNLAKIRNNILNMSQVKLVFTSTANPMLWLVVEDLLYHLKSQEMKASVLAAETWKMKRTCMGNSSSTCPSSRAKTTPRPTSHGHSRLTRSSTSTTTPVPRK